MARSPTALRTSPSGRLQRELVGALSLFVALSAAFAAAGGSGRPAEIVLVGFAFFASYVGGGRASPVVAGGATGALFLLEAAFGRLDARHLPATVAAMAVVAAISLLAGRVRASATSEEARKSAGQRRRPMPGSLEYELQRSLRHTRYFSLLVARPDGLTGTESLDEPAQARVAATMVEQLRGTDAVTRRGGSDFWVILPETPSDAARVVGERIRLALGANGDGPSVSVSIGIASFPDDGLAARDLALAAERALQRATELGGNRTLLHSSREDVPASWKVTCGGELDHNAPLARTAGQTSV